MGLCHASSPISNVQVTLRGKKYTIEDGVTTVGELKERLAAVSGVDPHRQGRVLFHGKRLTDSDSLSEVGVTEGSQLNMIPGESKKKHSTTKSSTTKSSSLASSSSGSSTSSSAASPAAGDDNTLLSELWKQAGLSTPPPNVEELLGGNNGEAPSLQESMEMMSTMMKSPMFQEYMNDPDRLEQSRQMILQNPMLKSMMSGMPGMEDLLQNPAAWREAMQAAAAMYQNIDPDELRQAMEAMSNENNLNGNFNMDMFGGSKTTTTNMNGLFGDHHQSSSSVLGLDDLSEGDD